MRQPRSAVAGEGVDQQAGGGECTHGGPGTLQGGRHFLVPPADQTRFRVRIVMVESRRMECHLEDFGKMQGLARSALCDLLAAAESVGNDEPVVGRPADGGEKLEFADGGGDLVVLGMEAEGASHAAAAGSGRLEVNAETAEEGFLGGHLHERFVMAVSVDEGVAGELWETGAGREFLLEKFAEQQGLLAEGLGALVVRKQIGEFIAEYGDAGRFESNDGDAGFDLRLELIEDFEQQAFGAVEHAKVVKGASAAQIGARDTHAKSGGLKDFNGGPSSR